MQVDALQWFRSYLCGRGFQVAVNKSRSSRVRLDYSVPQGSCAGPVLYSVYASTIQDVIQPTGNTVSGFADDHIIRNEFKAGNYIAELESVNSLVNCLMLVNEWMNENRLRMNPDKTEFIMYGSRQQLTKCSTTSITVAGVEVQRASCIKYLGVHMDENLTFKEHIIKKCRVATINLYRIIRIRKSLTENACKMAVQALVMSHLDYCNSVLVNLPDVNIAKLQRVQNFAAKIVLNKQRRDSSRQALFQLHWLPIHRRIEFKTLTLVYKALHHQGPKYLSDLLTVLPEGSRTRSGTSKGQRLLVPFVRKNTFAERSFAIQGPRLWNAIPDSIKFSDTINVFKKNLKTYIFKEEYSNFM